MRITLIVTIAIAIGAGATNAQEPDLVTDRPDFTESAVTVPRSSVQFEGGTTWERVGTDDWFSGPELLVRWGLTNRLELRLVPPNLVAVDTDRRGAKTSGLGDGAIGAKVALGGEPTAGWDLAMIATASLPTGEDGFTSDAVDPAIIVAAGRDVAPGWSLGTQVQAEWPTVGDEREPAWGATLVVGRSLGERAGAFLEMAVMVPNEGDESTVLHHGYTLLVSSRFQLDAHVGVGLSDAAPDVFAGAGFALRR
jgi:hypothetical protein